MLTIKVLVPSSDLRRWHQVLIVRLASAGHRVLLETVEEPASRSRALNTILALERLGMRIGSNSLAAPIARMSSESAESPCNLAIDLTKCSRNAGGEPTLTILFSGSRDLSDAASEVCKGSVPIVDLCLDGVQAARAAPMADSRVFVSRALNDVLAGTIRAICRYVDRYDAAKQPSRVAVQRTTMAPQRGTSFGLIGRYAFSMLPRLAMRALRQLRYYSGHWYVGYRFIEGPGVLETGSLQGASWSVLPGPGDRFYADPFPFEWRGRYYIFVEEMIHAAGKGFISVAECDSNGRFTRPSKVLEEPFHLSYPQVFAQDGEVWMIPESGAGRRVALYRAEVFPTRWVEHRVLIADREIFDATLIEHNNLLWLIGSARDEGGSASDTMVVYWSESLDGHWRSHPMNPITIDKTAARPAGAAVKRNGDIVMPLQDGTEFYGCSLGFARFVHLDRDHVQLTCPVPLHAGSVPAFRHVHTSNRHGRLETIDGFSKLTRKAMSWSGADRSNA